MRNMLFICLSFLSFLSLDAQNTYWANTNFEEINIVGTQYIFPDKFRSSHLDYEALKTLLFKAPLQDLNNNILSSPIEISIPLPDGSNEVFKIVESPVYEEGLLVNFPGIKTFLAYCPNHPEWYSRFDITPVGFHGMILGTKEGTIFIDPVTHLGFNKEDYLVYYKRDFNRKNESMLCLLDDKAPINQPSNSGSTTSTHKMLGSCELRTYRLALSATGEYTTFHGGTVAGALAAQVTSMNRVNGVFEKDMAIHMNIIGNNNLIVYTNAATDPFTNGTPGTMINQNQTNTNAVIGSANYDIGHVYGTNSGGLAQLQSPCGSSKARGVTGSSAPVGDPFDIDYVAHEMGHQYGANHTQNNSCNRNNATAMEPGSASTIMGYAGICAPNVQSNSDDYFHGISMQEMGNFITGTGNSCAVNTPLANTAPTVSVPSTTYSIPASTPFSLTAVGSDPNANTLTYCWEQMDNATATMPPVATATGGPSFRSFDPSTSPTRYFPNLAAVVAGTTPTWEVLSSVSRTMNFRVVLRDNAPGGGCNDHEDVTVNIIGTAGPFVVTAPNTTGITWAGNSNQTVTWNVANTANAPISCANVNILISYNGGLTFPDTVATNVPNDGSQSILVPNVASTNALIIVQCANGTFYDVSNNTFTITAITNDYTFTASNTTDTVCISQSASYAVSVGVLGTFTNNVSLSVIGLPGGLSASFSANNAAPSYSSNLTLGNTGSVAPGTYNFTIQANSTSGSKTINASLVIIPNLIGPLNLTSPVNNATGVSSPLALSWSAVSGASYTITLASDAALNNVLENSLTATNTYTTGALAANTTFYWQVKAFNSCDTITSTTFSFTTANCAIYTSADVPVLISSSGTPTVTSDLIISGSAGTISDLNVISLSGTHTYISDLVFTLTSPNGTDVILLNNICGSQNNFNIQFDDAAANNSYPCPPIGGGTYIPNQALSAFNGENANGTWVLTIDDEFNQDGGSLNAWGIEICFNPPVVCTSLFDTTQVIACDSAQVNGTWYFSSTIISDTLIATNNCDSIFSTDLQINFSSPITTISQTTCNASSVGSSSVTLMNSAGCDSVVTTNTTLLSTATSSSNITACDSAQVNGTWYFASTGFNDTIVGGAANACDSVVTYNITINNSVNTIATIAACDSAQIAGTWYYASQVITQNLTGTNACDSTHTINLNINNSSSTSSTMTACDSAQVNGTWYFTSQQVSNTFTGTNNCDSTHTVNLTINYASPVTFIAQTTCNASSVGSSSLTLVNAAGCDSVVTTNTSLLNGGTGTLNITACDSALLNGTWYFASTSFSDTLVGGASSGCDSIVNIAITVNNSASTNANITACDSAQIGGTWYYTSQVITQNLTGTNTCDSTHTINLNINNSVITNSSLTACDSAQVNGTWYFTSQQVSNNFTSANNCDSTHTVNLTINYASPLTIITQTTCNASSVGSSSITLTNAAGCDSVVTIITSFINGPTGLSNLVACDSLQFNGLWYTSSTSFSDTLIGAAIGGCDSIYTLNINILSSGSDTAVIVACGSYTWIDGLNYTSSNNTASYVNIGGSPNGCDLNTTLNLTILPVPSVSIVNINDTLTASLGLSSYQWYLDSVLIPNATSNTYTPFQSGEYYCLASNGNCSDTSNHIIYSITGIQNLPFANVYIFPNPANDILNIQLGGEKVTEIRLIDLNGKIVSKLNVNRQQFDMKDYARGMYFIELLNDQERAIEKIMLK